MRTRFLIVTSILFLTLQSLNARADDVKAGTLVISQPWSRATPAGAQVASGYLTITNNGTAPDRLLGGSSETAANIDVHEMASNGGVMTMRAVDGGVALAPGATVTLAPGGLHLMLTDIKKPLKQGDRLAITLKFEKAGDVAVTFNVLGIGAKGPGGAARPAMAPMGKGDIKGDMKMDQGRMKM
jgi:periplasmic copper chaperone A